MLRWEASENPDCPRQPPRSAMRSLRSRVRGCVSYPFGSRETLEMILSISQIHVPVKDLKRAVAFYRDVLGMKFLFEVPNMAFFDCDGVRVMLGVPESPEFNHPASIIYYSVDNILHVHATLRSSGVQFVSEPQDR